MLRLIYAKLVSGTIIHNMYDHNSIHMVKADTDASGDGKVDLLSILLFTGTVIVNLVLCILANFCTHRHCRTLPLIKHNNWTNYLYTS